MLIYQVDVRRNDEGQLVATCDALSKLMSAAFHHSDEQAMRTAMALAHSVESAALDHVNTIFIAKTVTRITVDVKLGLKANTAIVAGVPQYHVEG